MDAEEERLRFTLLAVAPGDPPNFPLDGLRRALSELPVAGQDNFLIRRFWPENFIISFTAQCARDAALAAGNVPVSGFRFILRPWTRLARAEQRTLFYCVALELDGVPPHAWGCQVARKVLAPSCWVERVEEVHADHSDMSKIKVQAWTDDPSRIPRRVKLSIPEHELLTQYDDPMMQRI